MLLAITHSVDNWSTLPSFFFREGIGFHTVSERKRNTDLKNDRFDDTDSITNLRNEERLNATVDFHFFANCYFHINTDLNIE